MYKWRRSEERRVGKECRSLCDWSSDVCSSDLSNHDRAPYELGHLLQQLPADFGLAPAVELKHVQMASAAEAHAHVAGDTVLSGIEAIGHLMEAAGTSGEESMQAHTLFCLGGLLRHLAVEGQYLRGVGDSLAHAVALYGKRDAAICRKEVRHA